MDLQQSICYTTCPLDARGSRADATAEPTRKPSPTTELGKRREFDPENPFDGLRESDEEDEEEDGDALMPPPLPPMRRVGIPRTRN